MMKVLIAPLVLAAALAGMLAAQTPQIVRVHIGPTQQEFFGRDVISLGDVDGDGFADYAASSDQEQVMVGGVHVGTGSAKIFSGQTGAVLRSIDSSIVGERFGISLGRIDDMDGDGVDDLAIGSQNFSIASPPASFEGRVQVFSSVTGGVLFSKTGLTQSERLGRSIDSLGDINGDGVADLVAGAHTADPNMTDSGLVRVLCGSTGGVIQTENGDAGFDLLGYSVASIGDLTSDGRRDYIAGAPGFTAATPGIGKAKVVDALNNTVIHFLVGTSAGDEFGFSVSSMADLDSDGIEEILIGSPGFDGAAGSNCGAVHVYSGLSGALIATVEGIEAGSRFGASVARIGDVSGDGIEDLAVGADRANDPGIDSGAAYVVSGFSLSIVASISTGTTGDVSGFSIAGTADLDGDGCRDLLVGAPLVDNPSLGIDAGAVVLVSLGGVNAPLPGTGEDFVIQTGINGSPNGCAVKEAHSADLLTIRIDSPNETFSGFSVPILGAQFFVNGMAPGPFPLLPALQLDPLSSSPIILIYNGNIPGPLGVEVLPFAPMDFAIVLPFTLNGNLSLMLQAVTLTTSANNGVLASTDAHVIRLVP